MNTDARRRKKINFEAPECRSCIDGEEELLQRERKSATTKWKTFTEKAESDPRYASE